MDTYKICTQCDYFSNSEQKENFCLKCGSPLIDKCQNCGKEITNPYARNCTNCGNAFKNLSKKIEHEKQQ